LETRPRPLQINSIGSDPAKFGGVVYLDAPIQQHEFEIAVTDGERETPSHRPEDQLISELPIFERLTLHHRRLSTLQAAAHCAALMASTETLQRKPWRHRGDMFDTGAAAADRNRFHWQ
jgi:hypothetical protein